MDQKQEAMENLAYIKAILEESNRKKTLSGGADYILWGIIVLIGMLGNYLPIKGIITIKSGWYFFFLWGGIISIGWIISFTGVLRTKKITYTHSTKVLNAIWLASGITMSVTPFAGMWGGMITPYAICPVIATILGSAYFITGELNRFNWMKFVAIGWWLTGMGLFFYPKPESFIVFAIAMILFQILPGVKMNSLLKKQVSENDG